MNDNGNGVFKRQGASPVGSRDLSDTMAAHGVRLDSPAVKLRRQHDLLKKQQRLDDIGAIDMIRIGLLQRLQQRPSGNGWHQPRNALRHLRRRRAHVRQIAGHPRPLAALSGKNEQAMAQLLAAACRLAGCFGCLQRRQQLVSIDLRRSRGDADGRCVGATARPSGDGDRLRPGFSGTRGFHSAWSAALEHCVPTPAKASAHRRSRSICSIVGRWRRQHGMGVGSAKTERIDPAIAAAIGRNRPGLDRGRDPQPETVEVNLGIAALKMKIRRKLAVVKRKRKLGQTGGARSRLQVTEIGFDRTDPQRIVRRTPTPKRGAKRFRFNWIADRGSRAMGLDPADPVRDQRCRHRRTQSSPSAATRSAW